MTGRALVLGAALAAACSAPRLRYESGQAWVQLGERTAVYVEARAAPLDLEAWRAGTGEVALDVLVHNRMAEPLEVVVDTVRLVDHAGAPLERLDFAPGATIPPDGRVRFDARFAVPAEGGTYGAATAWTLRFDLQHPEGRLAAEVTVSEEWPFQDDAAD